MPWWRVVAKTGDMPLAKKDPRLGIEQANKLVTEGIVFSKSGAINLREFKLSFGQFQIDIAFRAIADHIRTLSFAIADGIMPSNEGRGYVLRRILRRAVRYGRSLGFHEAFFFKVVDVVGETMGDVFPEVLAKRQTIAETIRREEESFNRTLDKGIEPFRMQSQMHWRKKVCRKQVGAGVHPQQTSQIGRICLTPSARNRT
jgi:alanyl-tRNA synthetase